MKKPYQSGLLAGAAAFLVCCALDLLLMPWAQYDSLAEFWLAMGLLNLRVSILVGLIAWVRAHLSSLRSQIADLKIALEKLRRER